jgi:uncharacterized protein
VIVCDTGPLYAAADTDDAHHDECLTVFESVLEPLVVPLSVVVEVSLLVEGRLGSSSEAQLLRSLASRPPDVRPIISIERLGPSDLLRTAELVETYADLPLGTVDASVVAVAERLGSTTLFTIDRRDFTVVRPAHVDAFTLLP